jgi:ribose transport system permease protein
MNERTKSLLAQGKKLGNNQILFISIFWLVMCIAFAFFSPHFFTFQNFTAITIQASVIAMLAAGQTFVILSGGIGLDAGSVVALSSVLSAMVMAQTGSVTVGLIAGLLIGLSCGVVNGLIIGKLGIPPFVATLGMMQVARGLALIITKGIPVYQLAEGSDLLGQGRFLGFPICTITVLILFLLCFFLLTRTRRGRYTYAIGSNIEASFLSGININKQIIWIYAIAGISAGLAGLTELSRIGSGQPGSGNGYELDAIAAVVLGGTSMQGGVGSIWGSLLGALLIATMRNGLNVINVDAYWQQVAIGVIIVLTVYLDKVRNDANK